MKQGIKHKILFIDRDGILLKEPSDQQVDQVDKVEFPPQMLNALSKIAKTTKFKLVMVTNQDGLGTDSYPESDFWPIQELLLRTLKSVGVEFDEIHIDRSFPKDNSPYRKPGTAMLSKYQDGSYDLASSFVIGDRWSDMELAFNLGCKGIRYNGFDELAPEKEFVQSTLALDTDSWNEIESFLLDQNRTSTISRLTSETKIEVSVNLDGSSKAKINTGLAFFDHMLDQIARHSGIDLDINTQGDLHIDEHHTMEDTAIALGQCLREAIGVKAGINRYGFALPMDDVRAQVLLDFGGRPWIEWDVRFKREMIGDCPTEMFYHFFKSLADQAQVNLNIIAKGKNEHHKIEAIFKAFAKALKMAITRQKNDYSLPTTKGML